jgi:hypothetical protein
MEEIREKIDPLDFTFISYSHRHWIFLLHPKLREIRLGGSEHFL